MATVLVTVVLVLLLFGAMSVGVLLGRAPVRGSCGGMGAAGVEGECVAGCDREPGEPCPRRQADAERDRVAATKNPRPRRDRGSAAD